MCFFEQSLRDLPGFITSAQRVRIAAARLAMAFKLFPDGPGLFLGIEKFSRKHARDLDG